MFGHTLDVTKNMPKQQQEILVKHKNLTEQKVYTILAPVHRDEFYLKKPFFTLEPTTEREGIQKTRFL